jgi:hypothetical protein
MELSGSGGSEKTYIHANGQIIAQHAGDHTADRYFYLHDRLGSVRLLIDTSAGVKNRQPHSQIRTTRTKMGPCGRRTG